MHFCVYRKMLDELRVAVLQPGNHQHAQRLASVHPEILGILEDIEIDASIVRADPRCSELELLMRRLTVSQRS